MGKEGDLWDDSALVKAFDDAISKYKIMHKKAQNDSLDKGGNVVDSTEESLSAFVDESQNPPRYAQAGDNSNDASNTKMEAGETSNLMSSENNHVVDSFVQEPNASSSYLQHAQDGAQGYSGTQGAEDYTQLLNQYYELEEQKPKILQQLQHLGNWNYQDSGSTVQWGAHSASQEHPMGQPSYTAYCPYVCQCLVAPCSFGGACVGKTCGATPDMGQNGNSPSFKDGNIIETAIGAAERALSSFKIKSPEKGDEVIQGQLEQSTICETNLTDVFNAWYSAGFHTGKYLAEQSMAKKRHG